MQHTNRKKAGIVIAGIFLFLGLLALVLYLNRNRFMPSVKEVTYLKAELGTDTTLVFAGIRVLNRAPFGFKTDSITYQIRNNGTRLGWGNQVGGQTLPAFSGRELDVRIFLDTERYQNHLRNQQGQDSLQLDVAMQIYLDLPLLGQQTYNLTRSLKTPIPKAPAMQIDSFFVKSFSPEKGYTFQLNLNTGSRNLPDLTIENLAYSIRLDDSLTIQGHIDSVFKITNGNQVVHVPIHLETAELIELLRVKLSKQKIWAYEAKATGTLHSDHRLFENTNLTVTRSGRIDTRKVATGPDARPSVKQIETLQLVTRDKTSYLQANLLVNNPTILPLYLDSARYIIRYKGKLLARGGDDFETVFPANGSQQLPLRLAVNNRQYKQIMAQPKQNQEIPLDIDLLLHYNLKDAKPKHITVKKKIAVPVTQSPEFEVDDIGIKQLDPEKGAQLLVKLKVKNPEATRLQIDDLNYRLTLKKDIILTGKTTKIIPLDSGTSMIEIPVNLSGDDVNRLAKGLMQGIETWEYTLAGTATVSAPISLLHQTEVSLQTDGVYEINSKGTPDFMPEISKIDTLYATIHYDTAWVKMYAAIYNTLPATILLSKLQVDVIHQRDTIGKTEEKLNLSLAPNANSFAWHTLGINYALWEKHVLHHQNQDSMLLRFPATLYFNIGPLGKQQVDMDLSTQIPTPATPVTLLQRLKLRSFGFRKGLEFDAVVAIQNANTTGLVVKNIDYQITLENGVDICGKVNRTYPIPLGISEVLVPINLSVWEALQLLTRQLFGPPLIDYKINASADMRTDNPKLSSVHVIFENWNQSDLRKEKRLKMQERK